MHEEPSLLKAVIFDMDGVLIDSEPVHVKAEMKTFASHGVHMTVEALQANMGRGMREFFTELIRTHGLKICVDDLIQEHKKTLATLYCEEVTVMPGAMDLIASCRNEALTLAVASSTDRDLILKILGKLKMLPIFDVIVSGQEVAKYKPNPDIFLETVRQLEVLAEECVIIEDSSAGVNAAKAASVPCIGFRSPNSSSQDLGAANLIVDSLAALDPSCLRRVVSDYSVDR
jgi:HAD superfamily hydrolase (TIGR01509 family)